MKASIIGSLWGSDEIKYEKELGILQSFVWRCIISCTKVIFNYFWFESVKI